MIRRDEVVNEIVKWLKDYANEAHSEGFVVGISGGVDSAVCSVLAAMTGLETLVVSLPIHTPENHLSRAREHIAMLKGRFANVSETEIDLSPTFDTMISVMPKTANSQQLNLTDANTRSRLRMVALYYCAGLRNSLVVGTGNKIEDFGIGFFTKYGDGGVDISPIGDLTKSEVYELAEYLGVSQSILSAPPADGLFADNRSDEAQIGATYPELEWAMEQTERGASAEQFEGREREVFDIFTARGRANRHKIEPIPFCRIKR